MHPQPHRRRRIAVAAALAAAGAVLLSGCSDVVARGWLPGSSSAEVTNQTGRIVDLWVGSWIAALAVGVLTWGLMVWAMIAHRKRKDDDVLPVQLRYHVPLEIMYTIVPVLMVLVLYYFTARDQSEIMDTSAEPDVTIQVIGKQWSWDFNYVDEDVYDSGIQAQDVGTEGSLADQVTLYLPVDSVVEFDVTSRDVIHSFWVPAFLFKIDAIPSHTNTFQIETTAEGTYVGKCAELCGEYHSAMLFNVKVVSQEEYDAHIAELAAAGQTGQLGLDVSREQSVDDAIDNPVTTTEGSEG